MQRVRKIVTMVALTGAVRLFLGLFLDSGVKRHPYGLILSRGRSRSLILVFLGGGLLPACQMAHMYGFDSLNILVSGCEKSRVHV